MVDTGQLNNHKIETDAESFLEAQDRPICNFWIRLLALLIDIIIIGTFGVLLGFLFLDFFASIGIWGRLFGFGVYLCYYGLLNSVIGKGQTIGKKLTRIRVINKKGGCISIPRSLQRSVIVGLPYFLNGAAFSRSISESIIGLLILLIIFGGGFSIIYLYVFNRKTRQSLHDLFCGTYVVKARTTGAPSVNSVWRLHYIICIVFTLLVLIFAIMIVPRFIPESEFIDRLYRRLSQRENVSQVGVSLVTVYGPKGSYKCVSADVAYKVRMSDYEAEADRVARVILNANPPISAHNDMISIRVRYGFDIGIAYFRTGYSDSKSPLEWEERLRKKAIKIQSNPKVLRNRY